MLQAATIERQTIGPATERIGPNAVLQLLQALRDAEHETLAGPLFYRAGAGEWLNDPPSQMIDAARVGRIHQLLRTMLPRDEALAVLSEAGRLTADYLLANRIPHPAQALLRVLPASWASRAFVPAIRAHAWTFAGAGRFTAIAGHPTVFEIIGNPLCAGERASAPVCAWHVAVFERLFQALVSPNSRAVETGCAACGAAACRFEVDWRATTTHAAAA